MPRAMRKRGTKDEVYYGEAMKTHGGLRQEDLMLNKRGKVVSIKQHNNGLTVGAINLGSWLKPQRP